MITAEERALRLWKRFVGMDEPCRHWPGTDWIAKEIRLAVKAERNRKTRKARKG